MSVLRLPHRLSHRMAATGVATALVAGALVAGGATTSDAAVAGGATYTCTTALGPVDFPLAVSSDAMPTSLPAGSTVPAGIPVTVDLTVPAALVGGLATLLGVTGISGTAPDFMMLLGSTGIPVDGLAAPVTALPVPPTDMVLTSTGTLAGFTAPAAGTYDWSLPGFFTLNPVRQDGAPLPAIPCAIKDGSSPKTGSATVTKNASTTVSRVANAPVHKGTRPKLRTKVSAPHHVPTGKVVAKLGTKTIGTGRLNDRGVAVFRLALLGVGSHRVVVKYPGDSYTRASKGAVTVRVVR